MLSAEEELGRWLDRKSRIFETAFFNLLGAVYRNQGDPIERVRELARLIQHTMILADLHGRRRTLLESDYLERAGEKAKASGDFAALPDRTPVSYGLTFEEAVDNLVTREPRLARSAKKVSELYNSQHVFALARSASRRLTDRVQEIVARMVSEGVGQVQAEGEILKAASDEAHDFARSYAATVARTNISNAYNEGRMAQVKDPDVGAVIRAFEYTGVDDSRTRRGRPEDHGENHLAAFGFIAATTDPVWRFMRPPASFQCRCSLLLRSKYELERRGLLRADGTVIRYEPPGFHAFRGHPDFHRGVF
jgi:SPP1 gp7 family putative phage head morphogenesis protein